MCRWTRLVAVLHALAAQEDGQRSRSRRCVLLDASCRGFSGSSSRRTAQDGWKEAETDGTRRWRRLIAGSLRALAAQEDGREIAPTTCGLRLRPSRARAEPEPSWRARPEVRAGRGSPGRAVAAAFEPSRAPHITIHGVLLLPHAVFPAIIWSSLPFSSCAPSLLLPPTSSPSGHALVQSCGGDAVQHATRVVTSAGTFSYTQTMTGRAERSPPSSSAPDFDNTHPAASFNVSIPQNPYAREVSTSFS
ncbi:hypothetical protein OH76DRAFT_1196622 [Lentinus brumalis]|uniref:Uncharacterized protein n=1 Tax=Lentinus brumalis TaxID=2498619 RepID=A0A371CTC7_9APHY|nr:hypothetical protein OH76DRAFT_1196622 [Polyporus brumalis]